MPGSHAQESSLTAARTRRDSADPTLALVDDLPDLSMQAAVELLAILLDAYRELTTVETNDRPEAA